MDAISGMRETKVELMKVGLVCQVSQNEFMRQMTEPQDVTTYESILDKTRLLHRFILLTIGAAMCLIGWGGFVTSINAGLAVPDWPTSFNSWDPLTPFPGWWKQAPILAEHGHRLLGAIVGLLTLTLTVWTWRVDPRPGVKGLAVMALVVVIFQGVLGGLRVVLVSLDLAMVHALTAQIFFGILVTLAVMTSPSWMRRSEDAESAGDRKELIRMANITAVVILIQIGLGTLLRHPGQGIDLFLAIAHIVGATVVFITAFLLIRVGLRGYGEEAPLRRGIMALMFALTLQVVLGITAYFVLLSQSGLVIPSNLQVVVNSLHVVVGAVLWGTAVAVSVWAHATPEKQS
jgi:cytochrome c oxidase assembly protein subunit 15